jgi:hypothetical protein
MADAMREDILIPLDLAEVRACVRQKVDPAARYARASIETAMHAVLPHRVILHVHCVNTIAWAVRQDARVQLEQQLNGLRWQWISYVPSGLPLAQEIEKLLSASGDSDVLVLGNHGLVIGGDDCSSVEGLMSEVGQRLAICPRSAQPADYDSLAEIADDLAWDLPNDDQVHALGTDAISRAVLSRGILYPCQAMLSNSNTPALFESIPCPARRNQWESRYSSRPFLIIEGRGVIVSKTMTRAERKMISGLAQVVQRISSSAALHYLTEVEVADGSVEIASRYRDGTDQRHSESAR